MSQKYTVNLARTNLPFQKYLPAISEWTVYHQYNAMWCFEGLVQTKQQ